MESIRDEMIEFPSDGQTTPGYLAYPEDGLPHPGIVLIQEWWGLVPHIEDVARRFAREGFYALAPDLYHGKSSSEPDEARKLAMELEEDNAYRDIQAAINRMKEIMNVQPKKLGVVGWCMGGGLSLLTAELSADVGADVIFYGHLGDMDGIERIKAPVLGLFAEKDRGVPASTVHEFEQRLEKYQIPHEVIVYPRAQHAFFNDTRPGIYDPEASADAWFRTIRWFNKYLV